MDWRLIFSGLLLQWGLGLFLLKTNLGQTIFGWANGFFTKVIQFSNEGASFLFSEELVKTSVAFTMLPTIVFVSTLSALLFYLGIMQWLVRCMAWVMIRVMNVSGLESLAAAANVYLGMTEAPLLIRPYLGTATRSELLSVMSVGMATIAGGVMAIYVSMGAQAGHLLTGSLMAAPAALVLAKILLPETAEPQTRGRVTVNPPQTAYNLLDAGCRGATDGLMLALNVGVMLLATISVIAMLNWFLTLVPELGGSPVTLQRILGWFFCPLAWLIGVPSCDIFTVGGLLGQKIVLNEFISYIDLISMYKSGLISPRSFVLSQYALCGFANIGSLAILLGGLGQLIPERREDLAGLVLKALIAGTLASLMSACVAGVLI